MKTAIITGASAGLGREFVLQSAALFDEVEEFWLIARRQDKLAELAGMLAGRSVKILPLDLCDNSSFSALASDLQLSRPEVTLLINNAGCGYLGNIDQQELDRTVRTVDLNIRALSAVTQLVLRYMPDGGRIINVSSIASFCPNPRMTVYSASKAYVSAFSAGLRDELRSRKISVTAVCPGPMDTEFVSLGGIKGNSPMFKKLPYCQPDKVVQGALKASVNRRGVYTPTGFFKFYRFVAKLMPQALMIKFART